MQPQILAHLPATQLRADRAMLALIRLPLELLWVAFCILIATVDCVTGRRWRRFESRVLVKASREAVCRQVESDLGLAATNGTALLEIAPHAPSQRPAEGGRYHVGVDATKVPRGTTLALHVEATFETIGQRVKCPLAIRREAIHIKWQCEKEAGTQSEFAQLANHWLVLSLLALLSFWYLWGWREALLIALIVLLHELGHAAAMWMVGISVQGVYLIPFFGGAAVPKTAYRSLSQRGFIALMGPGFSLIPTLGLAGLYYTTGDTWALHAAFLFALINGSNLLPIYPLDGGLVLNSLLGSVSSTIATAAAWVGLLAGLGAALYFQSLLLGVAFLVFALQLARSGTRTAGLARLTSLNGTALALAFTATFALYLATFVYANNTKSVLAGQGAVGPLEAWLGIPVRCDLPADSADVLDRFLSEPGAPDALSFIRILAQADRAGDGDTVRRWLEAPGFNTPPDLGFGTRRHIAHWLALARSGSLAAIEAEIAGSSTYPGYSDLRNILTAALVVHARYQDAVALLPPRSVPWKRWGWLEWTLLELVSAGAFTEAASLLERTRSDTLEIGHSLHLRAVASVLQRWPAGFGEKGPLVTALVDQLQALRNADPSSFLPACLPATSPACTDDDKRTLARQLRGPSVLAHEIELLARFGRANFDLPDEFLRDPRRWWHVLGVFAAFLTEQGEAAKAEALHNLVMQALLANAQAAGQADAEQNPDQTNHAAPPLADRLEIAYATTRVSLSLSRGDIEMAEALAQTAMHRFGQPTSIRNLMVDHYLSAGDWSRANAWNKRDIPRETTTSSEQLATRAPLELAYQLNLATAATEKGEMVLADRALERARSIACEQASRSAYLRHQWPVFLRRAYPLRAVREGRLPPNRLDRTP